MRRRHSGSGADNDDDDASAYNQTIKIRDTGDYAEEITDFKMDKQSSEKSQSQDPKRLSRKRSIESRLLSPTRMASNTSPRQSAASSPATTPMQEKQETDTMTNSDIKHRAKLRSPWACSLLTLFTTALSFIILATIGQSFLSHQLDPKGCHMSMMAPAYAKLDDFDTEYTRYASKYSLYLYREGGVDLDTRVKGIPVLFIPGNAGSYKQARPFAADAARYFHDVLQHDESAIKAGKRTLDFFLADFNEDITAFHGQTLLDQADYLNDAVAYILALYHNPHRSLRDPALPDPTSVIILGHSMGGIVARTMLIRPNYLANSINTIVTLSAPHARAPISFDSDIVKIYDDINDYWRKSYAEEWASRNPLWHVTLVSIAGGGLDTVVPSDYASLTSLVPPTHGFTVFTSTIPNVWTGMDHLAITWCDQFRKSVVRALFDVVDVNRPSQTRSRAERIQVFRKRFLTGMEPVVEKQIANQEAEMLLTLEDQSTAVLPHGERLALQSLGQTGKTEAYLLPIPLQAPSEGKRFTLLTDQRLNGDGNVEVYFCSVQPHQHGSTVQMFSFNLDLSNGKGTTRLSCKSAAVDAIALPASYADSQYAFDDREPFSYLQYELKNILEYQFIAVVDKANDPRPGWVAAEFSSAAEYNATLANKFTELLTHGIERNLPASRPMVNEIHIPVIHSSLLAYRLEIEQDCDDGKDMFKPLLRQYIIEPYETKFFPNARSVNVSLHGVSPYVPPPTAASQVKDGLSLQIWSDPTCNSTMKVTIKLDLVGSAGKLYMRYRTVFAAFPLLAVALVLRKQFKIYNATGIFISFTEAMDQCIRTSLPLLFVALSFLALSLSRTGNRGLGEDILGGPSSASETFASFTKNELLLGSHDPFFWFLVPLFGLISVGVCIGLNYTALALTYFCTGIYSRVRSVSPRNEDGRYVTPTLLLP